MAGRLTGESSGPVSADRAVAIVPARWGSSRLPGKPLADVAGIPLVIRVARGLEGAGLSLVAVATDDERIAGEVRRHGFTAVMTGDCENGTERVLEAWELLGRPGERVINVQGDEPLVSPGWIHALLAHPSEGMSVTTLARRTSVSTAGSHDSVKVVTTSEGRALYFSRYPVPWGADDVLEHIGVYCFRPEALLACAGCGATALSCSERLEQLAWMEAGIRVNVVEGNFEGLGVDTPRDLERAVEHFRGD